MNNDIWLRKILVAVVFCLGALMTFSLKAQTSNVIDSAYSLEDKSRQVIQSRLLKAANEGLADITVLIVNDYEAIEHNELTKNIIMEWEAKLPVTKLPKKRAYIVINKATHQGTIGLGKDVAISDSLLYSLKEIQCKILTPKLIEADLKTVVLLASQGLIGAFEDWPVHKNVPPSKLMSVVSVLKWFALVVLCYALAILSKILFHKPRWQDMPISENVSFMLNEQASLDMAYWREHRHIESV